MVRLNLASIASNPASIGCSREPTGMRNVRFSGRKFGGGSADGQVFSPSLITKDNPFGLSRAARRIMATTAVQRPGSLISERRSTVVESFAIEEARLTQASLFAAARS